MESEIVIPPPSLSAPQPAVVPPWYGRWILAILLLCTYIVVQAAVGVPFVFWLIATDQLVYTDDPSALMEVPVFIWASLAALAVGSIATEALAWVWSRLWGFVSGEANHTSSLWLAWSDVQRIPVWLIVIVTAPLVIVVSSGVTTAIGPSEVESQVQLFTSPARQVFASIIVSTVVPIAEELIFRGALYGALLPSSHYISQKWTDHILPILVTTPLFSAFHLLGGFETLPPFIAIGMLSLYLGLLRAITGSVKASVVGHMTWNLIGAIFITLSFYLPAQ